MYENDQVIKIWHNFAQSLKNVFTGHLPKHRHNDQFISARNAAIDLAVEDSTAKAIANAYINTVHYVGPGAPAAQDSSDDFPTTETKVADVVVKELEAFPSAVSIYKSQKEERKLEDGAFASLLNGAKTAIGSVMDVFQLSNKYRNLMAVLKEGIELFEE